MKSIRKALTVSILAVILVVTSLLSGATYFSIRHELDEVYDENMRQVAEVVAHLDDEGFKAAQPSLGGRANLRGEEQFLIQIWQNETLRYTSHPSVAFGLQPRPGFATTPFGQDRMRSYRLDAKEQVVQVAQELRERHGVIGEIYRVLLVPVLIQLPLLALLIALLIKRGLGPLTRVADLIQKRSASFLEPLPPQGLPDEVGVFVTALNGLLARLQDALQAQRRFTGDAAHELRTPLAAVRLQLDILNRASNEAERQDALAALDLGVNRCTHLVQQLLELARQDPDTAAALPGLVNLEALVRDVAAQLRPLREDKGIALHILVPADLTVEGNSEQLQTMVSNLVHNAILYTPPQGRITVAARRDGGRIALDIADTGIGISPHDRERVFDRFYRVAGTGVTGSGLGLAIVKAVADAHHIEITVMDGPDGRGVTFTLLFPPVAAGEKKIRA